MTVSCWRIQRHGCVCPRVMVVMVVVGRKGRAVGLWLALSHYFGKKQEEGDGYHTHVFTLDDGR